MAEMGSLSIILRGEYITAMDAKNTDQ